MRRAVGSPEREGLLVRAVEEDGHGRRRHRARRSDRRGRRREIDGVEALYGALDDFPASGGELELGVVRGTEERTVTASFAAAGGGMSSCRRIRVAADEPDAEALDAYSHAVIAVQSGSRPLSPACG